MLCPQLRLIQDRQFRIPKYPIKMLIISYLDKAALAGRERESGFSLALPLLMP